MAPEVGGLSAAETEGKVELEVTGALSSVPTHNLYFSGKGGDGAKGGNGGAGGSGGNGVRKIILQKKSEEENSITVEKKLPSNEENLLGLGRVKSYRQKKETNFPKLPITDFLI